MPRLCISAPLPTVCTRVDSVALNSICAPSDPPVLALENMMPSTICQDWADCPWVRNCGPSFMLEAPTSRFVRTPGMVVMKAFSPSRLVGRTSSDCFDMSTLVAGLVTSTSGEDPVTVTDSCTVPTPSAWSSVAVNPSVSRTFSRLTVWNPDNSNATAYIPGGNGLRRYSPFTSVTPATDGTCNAGPVAVTVTPGRTAPDVS